MQSIGLICMYIDLASTNARGVMVNCENHLWICAIIYELSKVCNLNGKVGDRYLFCLYYSILVKSPI